MSNLKTHFAVESRTPIGYSSACGRGRRLAERVSAVTCSNCKGRAEYIDAHRAEINTGIKAALGQLNGTDAAAVTMMTGFSAEELNDLGGLPE